jgi:hypothetical protein
MVNVDKILRTVEGQSKSLAEKLLKQYADRALSDISDFLQKSRANLDRWTRELARSEISKQEFADLVQGQRDLAEMHALKQAGLAQVKIDTFMTGVLDIIISAAFAAIP